MTGIYDVHCHILPAVDDGAASMNEAMRLLKMEYAQGVRHIILTPHLRFGMFETPAKDIKEAFALLSREAAAQFADLKLHLGCEFHSSSRMTEVLKTENCRTMGPTRYVLTEFSGGDSALEMRNRIGELQRFGYRPVIAHAERCRCLRESLSFLEEICSTGALIQINAGSFAGMEGMMLRSFCKKALQRECVHLIGSDAHNCTDRKPEFTLCVEYLVKKFGETAAKQLLIENPQKLLTNAYL